MSQEEIYKILKSLGGEATLKEIKKVAKQKFPKATLYMYAKKRLLQLEKYGIVQEIKTDKGSSWKILKEY